MKTALFLSKFDTNFTSNELAPTYAKNLCVRNGIFYLRRMVKGKRYLRSLHTSDPDLARYLVRQILNAEHNIGTPQKNKKIFIYFSKHVSHNSSYITTGPMVSAPTTCIERRNDMAGTKNVKQNTKTNIVDFWKNQVNHNSSSQYIRDTKRLELLINNFASPYMEDYERDPLMIHDAIRKLETYKIPQGTHKGEKYSTKTIKETIKVLKKTIAEARRQKVIKSKAAIFEEIEDINLNAFKSSKVRDGFSEKKFQKLFTMMYELKNRNFRTINDIIANDEYKGKRTRLVNIRDNFEHYYYMILLLLFTGARANAIDTLRIRDINLKENYIWIHRDKYLLKKNDPREALKKLKTASSERKVPIADALLLLGFREFVKNQQKEYGPDAFLFEKIVKNKNKTGYRTQTANENLNLLFKTLGFKDGDIMQDVHSLKHSFYTSNVSRAGTVGCEAIAGQKHSKRSISLGVYTNINYDNASEEMIEIANTLSFPHIDILFQDQPENAPKAKQKSSKSEKSVSEIMNNANAQPKGLKLVSDPTGLAILKREDEEKRVLIKQYEKMGYSSEAARIMATKAPQMAMGQWPMMPMWRP